MLGAAISSALGLAEQQAAFASAAEYERARGTLLEFIERPFEAEVAQLVAAEKERLMARGLSAALVDAKQLELQVLKQKEDAIMEVAAMINRQHAADGRDAAADYRMLFARLNPLFRVFPKARIAKITRELIDSIDSSAELQVELCEETISWCKSEDRTFLKHRLQTKLANLFNNLGKYQQGLLTLSPELFREVKNINDKLLLVDLYLAEAKLNYNVKNIPKAKAALTAAKSNGNAINCPAHLQAEIDCVAGFLHSEEGDFRTAYSYFYEAFEAFVLLKGKNGPDAGSSTKQQAQRAAANRAAEAFQYMMLARMLSGHNTSDISTLLRGPAALEVLERADVKAVLQISKAYEEKNLERFQQALEEQRDVIERNQFLNRHISHACDELLTQAILKVVEPYSEVEIDYIARKARLAPAFVEQKLSQMILDQLTSGILDQKRGVFVLYREKAPTTIYQDSVEILEDLREIVGVLASNVHASLD